MKLLFVLSILFSVATMSSAQNIQYLTKTFVDYQPSPKNVTIAGKKGVAPIIVDANDWAGVNRVAGDLSEDIFRVTGAKPSVIHAPSKASTAIILGTIGRNALIDRLVRSGKLKIDDVKGQWESYVIQTVKNPFPGVADAVVIAGSDKRGTIYGAYELSEQAGVSPWYWWADVPVKKHAELAVTPGRYVQASPKVKYRGIFINDEAPCLSNWVYKNFGEYKHEFYVHVFELLLRLRANYLWPAMWNNCFNEDDVLNPKLADEYGIVMGTSHVEPMGRADKEWNRLGFKPEQWNYLKFPNELEKFWADGVRRNKPYETINTIAMRGKIDTPMSEDENISLLENIVAAQRKILAKEVNPDVTKVPQLWCLYKEVQNYYDKGMRVPDDVTLLWADDNWGNIRRLPTPEERNRKGGAGVYYHFDYVGGPRNYKWVDTNPLPRIWEQMHMAYERGADRIWIVNVGDIKPNEFPTEFFIRMGWDPDRWNQNTLRDYTANWANREFGPRFAKSIAEVLERYAKYNARRKPELLDEKTYSLMNYDEGESVVRDWQDLALMSKYIAGQLPANQRSAYFELADYPVQACANLNMLYLVVAENHLFAKQGRAATNLAYTYANELYKRDEDLQHKYHSIENGKWDHMMDQTHIGYTTWQQPDVQKMPDVVRIPLQQGATMGVSVEGSEEVWPNATNRRPRLPLITPFDRERHTFDVFNRGIGDMPIRVVTKDSWLHVSQPSDYNENSRASVWVDWSKCPDNTTASEITVAGPGGASVTIDVPIRTISEQEAAQIDGFVEVDGYVSIEAKDYKGKSDAKKARFVNLPDLGRTDSAVTLFPTTVAPLDPANDRVRLEYPFFMFTNGPIKVNLYLSPTQLLQPTKGLRYAISIDDQPLVTVNMHENYVYFTPTWEASVAQNAIIKTTPFALNQAGRHTLKFWAIDPGVVLQKIVIDTGGLKPSYLGPPASPYIEARK